MVGKERKLTREKEKERMQEKGKTQMKKKMKGRRNPVLSEGKLMKMSLRMRVLQLKEMVN